MLMERAQNLRYIMSDLNTKIKDLENEKMSLITVINILQNEHSRDDKPREKRSERKQCKTNTRKKPENVNVVYVDETENVPTHNRFDILRDHQEDKEITSTNHDTIETVKIKARKSQGGGGSKRTKTRKETKLALLQLLSGIR